MEDKIKEKKSEIYDLLEQQGLHRQQIDLLQEQINKKQAELNQLRNQSKEPKEKK